jgi:pseudouridine-5'-phosphate glycosidase
MQVRLSPEVSDAVASGQPVVALETSVVAHGLPPPHNLEAWRRSEQAVRALGAVPATIGIIDGTPRVGLAAAEVERLADPKTGAWKVGSGELSLAVAGGHCAGTTVSATAELAAQAGLRVLATGGIGGVHRGAELSFDISQDLLALSRHSIAVVCAGAKAVLDLPKTLEALETLAVPILGVGTRELPAFYCTSSGLQLSHSVGSAQQAARVARARFEQAAGGIVFCLPPPTDAALSRDEVEGYLEEALALAKARGVSGKAVTPFLLERLAAATGGRALTANLALLEHNAHFAAELAVELAVSAKVRS